MSREKRPTSLSTMPSPCISRFAGPQSAVALLTAAGLGSHNQCQRLIAQGRVTANGRPLADPQSPVDPLSDELAVDGQAVTLGGLCVYLVLHKPYQVLSTFPDDQGRPTVQDYVPIPHLHAAGRLDYDSEGLLLLTNDGWLSHRLTHPHFDHPKTYWVQVEGQPSEAALAALRSGVDVQGERTRRAEVERLAGDAEPSVLPRSVPVSTRPGLPTTWLRITLYEGRNRQIRRMTAAVGHPTLRLIRIAMGPLELGDLPAGQWRPLTAGELQRLAALVHPPLEGRARRRR